MTMSSSYVAGAPSEFRNGKVVLRVMAQDIWYVFPVNRLSEARAEAAVRQSVNRQSLQEIAVQRYTWRVLRVRREVVIGAHGQFERLVHASCADTARPVAPEWRMTLGLSPGSPRRDHSIRVPKGREGQRAFAMYSTRNFAEIVACPAGRSG